jgi:hypothetical protein
MHSQFLEFSCQTTVSLQNVVVRRRIAGVRQEKCKNEFEKMQLSHKRIAQVSLGNCTSRLENGRKYFLYVIFKSSCVTAAVARWFCPARLRNDLKCISRQVFPFKLSKEVYFHFYALSSPSYMFY